MTRRQTRNWGKRIRQDEKAERIWRRVGVWNGSIIAPNPCHCLLIQGFIRGAIFTTDVNLVPSHTYCWVNAKVSPPFSLSCNGSMCHSVHPGRYNNHRYHIFHPMLSIAMWGRCHRNMQSGRGTGRRRFDVIIHICLCGSNKGRLGLQSVDFD